MYQRHLPPGIEGPAHEAILALASCEGLELVHLKTIQYCIAVCPQGFQRAYIAYFDSLRTPDAPCPNSHMDHASTERQEVPRDHHIDG